MAMPPAMPTLNGAVLGRSIMELCVTDHGNDLVIL
jgi:hypothetical protein